MKEGPDIEALVTFISTDEGGRKSYALSEKYRPQHVFAEDWITSGVHRYINVASVQPGDSALANIWLLSPLPESLWVGREIRIQEAKKIVGHAKVTRIFNESLRRHN